MVFQHYALFPHFDVKDNVAYGLRQARPRIDTREIDRRVDEALEMVRLAGYGRRRTFELSGGQQQRVALARALVNKPAVLLLDEPLAALDKKLRVAMQIELQSLQRDLGITFVLVTHDQEEALSMSDLVCVMNGGRIVQLGRPGEVYDEPADLFVADFVGKTNLLDAVVAAIDGPLASVRLADGTIVGARIAARHRDAVHAARPATLSVRPEALRLTRAGAEAPSGALVGTVTNRIFLGASAEYAIRVPGVGDIMATTDHHARSAADLIEPGERVAIGFVPGGALVFAARTETRKNLAGSLEPSLQGEKSHVEIA